LDIQIKNKHKQKQMKVKQLIEKLSKQDPEKRVVVRSYEEGYDEINEFLIVPVEVTKDKKWWEGEFSYSSSTEAEKVLQLASKNASKEFI
jgi:hypothetical protein